MKSRRIISVSMLVVFFASVFVTSCKKDSSDTEEIVGNWTAGTTTLSITVGTKTLTQYFADTYGLNG